MKDKPSILVVDDDEVVLKNVEGILGTSFKVACCSDGREAVSLAEKNQPVLILLDINLVGMNGFEVLQELKENVSVTGAFVRVDFTLVPEKHLRHQYVAI